MNQPETINPGDKNSRGKNELPKFAIIPSIVFTDRRLGKNDLRVLGILYSRRNKKTGCCFPSKFSISNNTGINASDVRKSLKRLEGFGYVRRIYRKRPNSRNLSNIYLLMDPETGEFPPAKEVENSPPVEGRSTLTNIELEQNKSNNIRNNGHSDFVPSESQIKAALTYKNQANKMLREMKESISKSNFVSYGEIVCEMRVAWSDCEAPEVLKHIWIVEEELSKIWLDIENEYSDEYDRKI